MKPQKPTQANRPKRLVCVVEGSGEVAAVPNLCSRVADYLRVSKASWIVDPVPIRQSRSAFVDEQAPKPPRPPREDTIKRAVELALIRPANAVVLVCDSDDDCAAYWGPAATKLISDRCVGGAAMIVREYEAWLLCSELSSKTLSDRPIEEIRDAKGRLKALVPGYKPTVHQLELTRKIEIERLRTLSDSFDKFVRTLAGIFDAPCPMRKVDGG